MKGNVWIEQGATNIRTPQAVVWVDQASRKDSGIYNLKVYGENLSLPDGSNGKPWLFWIWARAAKCGSNLIPTK